MLVRSQMLEHFSGHHNRNRFPMMGNALWPLALSGFDEFRKPGFGFLHLPCLQVAPRNGDSDQTGQTRASQSLTRNKTTPRKFERVRVNTSYHPASVTSKLSSIGDDSAFESTLQETNTMEIQGQAALVTGGGSGLGEATARELARCGAKVAILDLNLANAERIAAYIGGIAIQCNVSDADSMQAAIDRAAKAHGPARILMQIAGIGTAKRVVAKDGQAAPLPDFVKVIEVNLIGTYNASRLFAAAAAKLEPLEDGERGVMVWTASVAAFDGQVGQQAYSASKAGVAGMTLPMARDLAQHGIRVCTIAPGLFATPLMQTLPEHVQHSLAESIPFPKRLGKPEEFAQLAAQIVTNTHLNGEVIRLDGALRMAPR